MPPLVRHQPRTYAAPPVPVPWWETLVAYVLVALGVVICTLSFFFAISLLGCEESATGECTDLTAKIDNGTVSAVRTGIFALLGLAALLCIGVHFLAGRLHFALVWVIAALPPIIGVVTISWATGVTASPWGHL